MAFAPCESQSAAQRWVGKHLLTWVLLTYMATLRGLDDAGALFKIDPGLPPGVQPERLIYASPRLVKWLDEVLPGLHSDLGVEQNPQEQMAILFEGFCAGTELAYGPGFHELIPSDKSIWELKTPDLRVIGWFAARDCYIAFVADTANRIKDHHLYGGYRDEAERFRDQLDLDAPKFVPGKDPHAVVSNYHYP